MFRALPFTNKIVPFAAPFVGVVCIGSYLQQEFCFQTRQGKKEPPPNDDDKYYRDVMFRYFHH